VSGANQKYGKKYGNGRIFMTNILNNMFWLPQKGVYFIGTYKETVFRYFYLSGYRVDKA